MIFRNRVRVRVPSTRKIQKSSTSASTFTRVLESKFSIFVKYANVFDGIFCVLDSKVIYSTNLAIERQFTHGLLLFRCYFINLLVYFINSSTTRVLNRVLDPSTEYF